MDTSVTSMRRSTYVGGGGNLAAHRASLHMNNNHGVGAGGRGGSFHRQDSMALQHTGSVNGNTAGGNPGGAGVGGGGGGCGNIGRASIINEKRWGTLIVELLEEGSVTQEADEQL